MRLGPAKRGLKQYQMKISVCMATYNGEMYIRRQLDSILKQMSADDELVISDDGSTDNTLEIIGSYKDRRIKLLHSTHKNLILNFENALKQASGDVVFLSDQDDIWFDKKVKKYKEHLKKNLLVFSNATMFYDNNNTVSELFFQRLKEENRAFEQSQKSKVSRCDLGFSKIGFYKKHFLSQKTSPCMIFGLVLLPKPWAAPIISMNP